MKTKLGHPNPSASSYHSKRDQTDKDAAVPGIKREKLSQERCYKKTLHKRFRRKTKGEGSPNSLKAKKRFQDQGHTRQRMSAEETEGN